MSRHTQAPCLCAQCVQRLFAAIERDPHIAERVEYCEHRQTLALAHLARGRVARWVYASPVDRAEAERITRNAPTEGEAP